MSEMVEQRMEECGRYSTSSEICMQLFWKLTHNKLDAVYFYESYPLRVNRDQGALFPHAVEMKVQFANTILMPRRMH